MIKFKKCIYSLQFGTKACRTKSVLHQKVNVATMKDPLGETYNPYVETSYDKCPMVIYATAKFFNICKGCSPKVRAGK